MNSYKKNKVIFNKIITEKYSIKKDPYQNNILYITTNDKKIKCKYILFLMEKQLDKKSDKKLNKKSDDSTDNNKYIKSIIIWSDSNPYIDNYTRESSHIIRNNLLKENNYLINQNNQIIYKKDLDDMVKSLIKKQVINIDENITNREINCEWILTNVINDTIEYYMITDIIYY
jgi:hypothetical protein